jgi:hypothetical protein
MKLIWKDIDRRAEAIHEAMASEEQNPNALRELLSSKRWNGGLGPLGPPDN